MVSRRKGSDQGFTLVEVLIALVVLAVGLLGIAALYIDSLRASRTALLRTQAVAVASDLADRIRSNRDACSAAGCAYEGEGVLTDSCESTVGCTAAELAANDLSRWRDTGSALLPNFSGNVDFVAGTPNQYVITVVWSEPGAEGDYSYSLTVYT
jgi:type IV pilus assembly protein PilV